MAKKDAASSGGGLRPQIRRLLKLWVWFTEVVHPDEFQVTLAWAGVIGFLGAVTSVGFRWATTAVHNAITGQTDVGVAESFTHLPLWQRFVTPAAGGLLAGLVMFFGARLSRSKTTTDYMEAVVLGDGRLSVRRSIVKCLSAMCTIASGGSIGREGPLVQLSSLVASIAGRVRKWSVLRLRLLVACGAAAGIASAYNAPIAGSLFVAEIILGSLAMELFGPLVFASVIATLTVRAFIGSQPLYEIPAFKLNSSWEIIPYCLLGFIAGFGGPWFTRLLRTSEELFLRIRAPIFVRMMLGGVIVGVLAIWHPEICGNGYSAVNAILRGNWLWQSLALILVFKVIATSSTFGSGAVGGVFTPTLFVGASLGYLFGNLEQMIVPALHINPSAFALVGMGAFLAATTHAPIMAIMMIFELTLDYQIILPLMLACVLAYYTSARIEPRSIYSESLKRKGQGEFRAHVSDLHVRDLMKRDPVAVGSAARFAEIAQKFLANRFNYLYVTDERKRFLGAVSLHDIKNYLNEPALADFVIAEDLLRAPFPTIGASEPLSGALEIFAQHDGERLPVVNDLRESQLVGSLSKTDLILAMAAIARPTPAATVPDEESSTKSVLVG